MIREFDQVVLTVDLPQYGLLAGDVGTVADIYAAGKPYETYDVEVFLADGSTYEVVTAQKDQIRPVTNHDVLHIRAIPLPTVDA